MKRYIKIDPNTQNSVSMPHQPVWGTKPTIHRDRDWNIGGVWYSNDPAGDLLDSTDPFGDGSLLHKWALGNDLTDSVGGSVGTPFSVAQSYELGLHGRNRLRLTGDTQAHINLGNVTLPNPFFSVSMLVELGTADNTHLNGWRNVFEMSRNYTTGVSGVHDRHPSVYYHNNAGLTLSFNNTTDTGFISTRGTMSSVMLSGQTHIVVSYGLNLVDIYVNGTLAISYSSATTLTSPGINLSLGSPINDGVNTYPNHNTYQQVEFYNRELTSEEVLKLTNQHDGSELIHDGVNAPTFEYLGINDRLLEVTLGSGGEITQSKQIPKLGKLHSDDNLLKVVNGDVVDSYGNTPLSGSIRRVISNVSNTLVSTTSSTVWETFNEFKCLFDTNKYDYIFTISCKLTHSNGVGRGDLSVRLGDQDIRTITHIGQYANIPTSPNVSDTFKLPDEVRAKGNMVVYLSLKSSGESPGVSITNMDLSDIIRYLPANQSTIVIHEVYK